MTIFQFLYFVAIAVVLGLITYVILGPFIYTLIKCKGIKKLTGLKYTLINLIIFIVFALIAKPLETYFNTSGSNIGKDLAAISNIVCLAIAFIIAFRFMKKTRTYVEKLTAETKNN